MISRIWHGWTTCENTDTYEALLRALAERPTVPAGLLLTFGATTLALLPGVCVAARARSLAIAAGGLGLLALCISLGPRRWAAAWLGLGLAIAALLARIWKMCFSRSSKGMYSSFSFLFSTFRTPSVSSPTFSGSPRKDSHFLVSARSASGLGLP